MNVKTTTLITLSDKEHDALVQSSDVISDIIGEIVSRLPEEANLAYQNAPLDSTEETDVLNIGCLHQEDLRNYYGCVDITGGELLTCLRIINKISRGANNAYELRMLK